MSRLVEKVVSSQVLGAFRSVYRALGFGLLEAVLEWNNAMTAQILNYMHLAKVRVGYLVNFGKPELEWKRLVLEPRALLRKVHGAGALPKFPYGLGDFVLWGRSAGNGLGLKGGLGLSFFVQPAHS